MLTLSPRSFFKPISTSVAGVHIGECFPQIASMFDKFTAIRTVIGSDGGHDGYQCVTGWSRKDMVSGSNYPSIGACASKILGAVDPAVPVAVGLAEPTQHNLRSYYNETPSNITMFIFCTFSNKFA